MPIVTVTFFPCNIRPGDICPYKQYFSCYWPNSDQTLRVVPGTLYFNCNGHICPGNIGPGKICPYHEYLSCYWHNFDKTFEPNFWRPWYLLIKIFLDQIFFYTKFFGPTNFFGHKIWTSLDPNFFGAKILWTQNFVDP